MAFNWSAIKGVLGTEFVGSAWKNAVAANTAQRGIGLSGAQRFGKAFGQDMFAWATGAEVAGRSTAARFGYGAARVGGAYLAGNAAINGIKGIIGGNDGY